MRMNVLLAAALFATLLGWEALGSVAFAQAPPPAPALAPVSEPTAPRAPTDGHALTAEDANAWLDGFMPYALQSGDIAGAVVVIVKDGAILTEKGYGYADVATETRVDPKNTLFRFGSTSKLLMWTAVMQQVEQGKLDLDTDINRYLDFKIPERDGKPVTLRNLMTHSAGFEERLSGLIGVEADGVTPLDQFLKSYIPPRIFAPGGTPAYSNYGAALAGYLVARVSGLSFDDYMDKYVLAPLAMHDSTFRQPLPERLKARLSKAYPAASLPPRPFEIVGPAPAGSLSSTGDDMAHFMIAHVQNGRYGETRILDNATAEMMHSTALTILPGINRMELGFYEDNINGRRVIAHGGDTQWFHSDLHLFLDEDVGLLISVNSLGKDGAAHGLRYALFTEFADRYFPGAKAPATVDAQTAAKDAERIAGRYEASRRVDSTFVSALYLLGQTTVQNNGDGTISVSTVVSPSGVPRKWREITPLLWREEQSADLLSAQATDGRVTRFTFGEGAAIEMFDRVPWWRSAGGWLPLLAAALAVQILTVLAWPVSALTRRHYRVAAPLTGLDARAQRTVRLASLASALVLLGWLGLVLAMGSDLDLIAKSGGWVLLLHILSPIVFFGTAGVGLWNAWVVMHAPRRWYAKFWALSLALSLGVSLWVALTLHLIAFSRGF
jgi:CubicO group peptidase (beta-lactamase class C family)